MEKRKGGEGSRSDVERYTSLSPHYSFLHLYSVFSSSLVSLYPCLFSCLFFLFSLSLPMDVSCLVFTLLLSRFHFPRPFYPPSLSLSPTHPPARKITKIVSSFPQLFAQASSSAPPPSVYLMLLITQPNVKVIVVTPNI